MCQYINLTSVPSVGHKTKTIKTPCGWCKMSLASHWCCVRLKILMQAWIFSASHTITPPGSCIHRKAINKNKPSCPLEVSVLPRIRRIGFWRKENKKFVAFPGLTPLQPGSDVYPCKQACLTEPPYPSGLPLADGKPQNKIAAVRSTK